MAEAFKPRLLINGKLVESSDRKTFPLYNPATHEKVADVPEATVEDVDAAVAAAKAAFPAWSAMDPAKRGGYMKKLAAAIRSHAPELARLEAVSMGRPVSQYIDAGAAAAHFDHYAESWPHTPGTSSSLHSPGLVAMTWRQPFGVAAAIVPWNVALLFFASKAAPALAAGNTVVVKSSEKAPLAIARVAQLIAEEAGFPPGVFNVLSGHGLPAGQAIAAHMDVRVLSFTGSTRTGRAIQAEAARSNLKKVVLELGGKSPAVVFDDADLEKAAKDTAHSIQWNSGQTCFANSRVYVHEAVAGPFVEAFKKHFAAVTAGDPTDPKVDHGPQADEIQYNSVLKHLAAAKAAHPDALALGGGPLGEAGKVDPQVQTNGSANEATSNGTTITKGTAANGKGYFVSPTVFVNVPEGAPFMRDEIFGPVVGISTFATEDEVVARANDTEFGLYAAVYTRDISRAMRVAKALESGYVAINCTSPTTARDGAFGGWKGSGQGREGWLWSLDNFLEVKSVVIKL